MPRTLYTTIRFLLIPVLIAFSYSVISAQASVAINEINDNNQVELKNLSAQTVNITGWWLCNFPAYQPIAALNVICGDLVLEPGEIVVLSGWDIDPSDGELGLYLNSGFNSPSAIEDYLEWGSSGHQRATVAQEAGIWLVGNFVHAFNSGESLSFDGDGNTPEDWFTGIETFCAENDTCVVDGGTLDGGPFAFCVGDGVPDFVEGVTVAGNSGTNSA